MSNLKRIYLENAKFKKLYLENIKFKSFIQKTPSQKNTYYLYNIINTFACQDKCLSCYCQVIVGIFYRTLPKAVHLINIPYISTPFQIADKYLRFALYTSKVFPYLMCFTFYRFIKINQTSFTWVFIAFSCFLFRLSCRKNIGFCLSHSLLSEHRHF